jgi:hypothetical protein
MLPERELASPKAMTEGCATIYYLLWRSAVLLACPFGEGAKRSDDGEGTASVAIKYRSSQQQFSRAIGHNANFVWNQDEASVKFDRQ